MAISSLKIKRIFSNSIPVVIIENKDSKISLINHVDEILHTVKENLQIPSLLDHSILYKTPTFEYYEIIVYGKQIHIHPLGKTSEKPAIEKIVSNRLNGK